MKVKLIGSAVGTGIKHQFQMTYLINDVVAIDAGCIGTITPVEKQHQIGHVLISHSHLDHIATLAGFLDNVFKPGPDCPTLYASQNVFDCLKSDVFNERLWPDLIRISAEESAFFRMVELTTETSVEIEGLRITPVELNHVVPTFGFLIEDDHSAVAIISDTYLTDRVWELANSATHLDAVFLDVSFPNDMAWLAEKAMHLTPELFGSELKKLNRDVRAIAIHIKPAFHDTILKELASLELPSLEIGEAEAVYEF